MPLEHRRLGRSGIDVSRLGLGGTMLASTEAERSVSATTIRAAVDAGITYFDTAPAYGDSESVLGDLLATERGSFVVSTKVGGRPTPFDPRDPQLLRRAVEDSLRRLRRDVIDVLFVHEPDRPGEYDWWVDASKADGPIAEVIARLQQDGLVRAAGLGGTTAYGMVELCRSGAFDVLLTAFNYSLLWREAEIALLPAAKEAGMGVVVGSPFQQGALARRWDAEIAAGPDWMSPPRRAQFRDLYALLDEFELPIHEAALRFVLENELVSAVLVGARSPDEVRANVAVAQLGPLAGPVRRALDEIAAQVPFRPSEEPMLLPFGRRVKGPGPLVVWAAA
ncbi:MAG: aldo/keto reductase [Propionibacteriaceae bacterium]|nr:aldo/keto reductase [Propionibacteriaceae bacterium]